MLFLLQSMGLGAPAWFDSLAAWYGALPAWASGLLWLVLFGVVVILLGRTIKFVVKALAVGLLVYLLYWAGVHFGVIPAFV